MEFKDFSGCKTYIVAVATVCYALGGAVAGYIDYNVAIPLILGALGFSGLRHGLTPVEEEEEAENPPAPGYTTNT